ncbi:MAG: polysaccharide ABC transporter ATP-binding protein [Thermodesulfobacteriota bacterium]
MSDIIIKVRDVGKKYRIGERNQYRTIRDSITSFTSRGYNKLISAFYAKSGPNSYGPGTANGKNDASQNYFWSLKNVNFDVSRGEVVGIIGRNGAGKSTLLKIITGITEPTEGRIDIYGRIASLLEVGTGFHFELTGRENIFLNGAILGMRRQEIERKFDEIVDFSEIHQFIDTPVKYYSSGMRIRLGFSVAAHLEPEILLIDEVLAVGDAAFQKKCLGKLNNVATSEGRTVLFVSHDMAAILSLCQRTIFLENGQKVCEGSTDQVVQQYMQSMNSTYELPLDQRPDHEGDCSVTATSLKIENSEAGKPIQPGCRLKIKIGYTAKNPIRYPRFIIKIRDFRTRINILRLDSDILNGLPEILPPVGSVTCLTEELSLTPGRCVADLEIRRGMISADKIENAGHFDIETEDIYGSGKIPSREQATSLLQYEWLVDDN